MTQVKFIYSEKATKFCEIFTFLLTTERIVKIKVKISQNVVAFSECNNFTTLVPDSRVLKIFKKDVEFTIMSLT